MSIILIAIIVYFFAKSYLKAQERLSDQVSDLQDTLREQSGRYHRDPSYPNEYESSVSSREKPENKDKKGEYTFQESQDRAKLGVPYDAPLKTIKETYHRLMRKGPTGKDLEEIQGAYGRLCKIETERKSGQ